MFSSGAPRAGRPPALSVYQNIRGTRTQGGAMSLWATKTGAATS